MCEIIRAEPHGPMFPIANRPTFPSLGEKPSKNELFLLRVPGVVQVVGFLDQDAAIVAVVVRIVETDGTLGKHPNVKESEAALRRADSIYDGDVRRITSPNTVSRRVASRRTSSDTSSWAPTA